MAETETKCANSECRIGQGGKCIEGHDELAKCPFFGSEPEESNDEQEVESLDTPDVFEGLTLHDALPLDKEGVDKILALLPSRMIGVIGGYDSGKTSIIAGLYDLFQLGPVSGNLFAGSSTLHGFEAICHDARAASERNEPHSERTKRGEVRFYHLDLASGGTLQSLLIADRSGEEYEEVADIAANASEMFELRRADVVTILVDGRRLASPKDRADVMGSIPLIVMGLVENGAFLRKPNLAFVLTKEDAVKASKREERVERDFQAIVEGIQNEFSEHFGELGSFVTCASPKDTNIVRGAGLDELLQFWLKPTVQAGATKTRHRNGRVFDGLVLKETSFD